MGALNSKNVEALKTAKPTNKALSTPGGAQLTALVERDEQKVDLSGCKRRGPSIQPCKQSCETRESKAVVAREPQAKPVVKQEDTAEELSSTVECYEPRRVLRNQVASMRPSNEGRGGAKKQIVRESNKRKVSKTTRTTRRTKAVQNPDAVASSCIVIKQEEKQTYSPLEAISSLELIATVKPDPAHLIATVKPDPTHIIATVNPDPTHIIATVEPDPTNIIATVKPDPAHLIATVNLDPARLIATVKPDPTVTDIDYKNFAHTLKPTESPTLSNSIKTRNCRVRLKKLSAVIKQEIDVLALSPKLKQRTRSNAENSKLSFKSSHGRVLRSHVCDNNKAGKIQKRKFAAPISANKRDLLIKQHIDSSRPTGQFNKSVRVRIKRIHCTKDIEAYCNNKIHNEMIRNTKQAKLKLSPSTSTCLNRNAKEPNRKIGHKRNETPLTQPTGIAQLLTELQPTVVIQRLNLHKLCELESGGYLVSDALYSSHRSLCNTPLTVKLEKKTERPVYDSAKPWVDKRSVYRKIKQQVDEIAALRIQRAYSLYPVVRLKRCKLPAKADVVVKQEEQIVVLDGIENQLPCVQLDHSAPSSYGVFVKQEEDSGISLDFETLLNQTLTSETSSVAANEAACDLRENVLVQIAAQRAYINAILLQNGYSPIQFKLYNNLEDLKTVLDYLLVK